MAGRGRPKKDKYADLPGEFREAVAGADDKKINDEIQKAALYAEALTEAKEADDDLKNAKEVAKEAGRTYREGAKICKLKVAYCRDILRNRGRELPGD